MVTLDMDSAGGGGTYSKLMEGDNAAGDGDESCRPRASADQRAGPPATEFRPLRCRLAVMAIGGLLALSLISVAMCFHYKNTIVGLRQELQTLTQNYSSPINSVENLSINITSLMKTIQRLQGEKRAAEMERDGLQSRITELEAQISANTCPPSWLLFNSSCYYISTRSNSWQGSEQFCVEHGGHLAIIHAPEEQTFIWNKLVRGHWNAYWIGISDKKAEGDWFWVDGTKLVGGFWMEGEPNNHIDEDCGYMVKTDNSNIQPLSSWYDAPCELHWSFICKTKLTSVKT
ncbi:C type lectin receptor C [Arapaima gigas]